VPRQHPWSCKAHNHLDLFTVTRFVAVNRAFIANRFFYAKGAFFYAFVGIIKEFGAVAAQILCRTVMSAAVKMDHGFNRPDFEIHVSVSIESPSPFQGCIWLSCCNPTHLSAKGFQLSKHVFGAV